MIDYLLLGHVTADLHPEGRTLGGTVAYSAPIAHLLGRRVGILTSCAPDEPLVEPLRSLAKLVIQPSQSTTTFENRYTSIGRVQIVHRLAEPLSLDNLPAAWCEAPAVHLAPLVAEFDPRIASAFPRALVMLTPQGLLRQWDRTGRVMPRPWLDEGALRLVRLVVLSKQDIQGHPYLEAQYAQIVEQLIVTDGAQGGVVYDRGRPYPYAAYPVQEVDATGAGDVFATALLASLPRWLSDLRQPQSDDLARAVALAVPLAARLAALAVTRRGVAFFTSDEVRPWLDA
ncbi:MAG: PfkB family carbohydrate kinase [Anaerolineae bacterium]|nr:PfkB family carbohydrate kinase [Anaerolineae bacterium]MDW8173061.1 PfkB family carbohydrate kinase [Anaerolineae bacterium]